MMQVKVSPFSQNHFVVIFNDFYLCEPEIEGGLPVQWNSSEGPQFMINVIQADGWGEYQWLSKDTCQNRMA